MNTVKVSRRLLALLFFLAVPLGLLAPYLLAAGRAPDDRVPGRPGVRGGGSPQPGAGIASPRRIPLPGDGKRIGRDVTVRSLKGVTGFDKKTTRVQVGGAGGSNVPEQIVNITQTNTPDEITPFWTADERFIYFSANRELGKYQIYRIDASASNDPASPAPAVAVRITNDAASDFLYPALNANSNRIAFVRSIDGLPVGNPAKKYDLYVSNVPASGFVSLVEVPIGNLVSLTAGRTTGFIFDDVQRPAWRGSENIVFSGRLRGQPNYHIFSANIASGLIFQLTDGPASEFNPAVSPNARYVAFDSNATGYTGGGTPRDLQNNIPGNPATASGVSGEREIFTFLDLGASPTQFTNSAIQGSHVQPTWSSQNTNPRINPQGRDVYIAFASTRRDVREIPTDPASRIVDYTAATTFDLYYVRALDPVTNAPVVETAPTGANPARKLDTVDPSYRYNDEYPSFSPFATIFRVCHQSDRTGSLNVNESNIFNLDSFTLTPGRRDLFVTTLVDIAAPTLIRYDTSAQNGELVHINLGTTFNPSTNASVRTPSNGVVPGADLHFTVRVEDRESGMQPEKAGGGRGAVFLVFKNPNSKYQQASGVEHKEWTQSFGSHIFPVTIGNNVPAPFAIDVVGSPNGPTSSYFYGHEYEAQAVSAADRSTYYYHTFTPGTLNPTTVTPSQFAVYTASVEDDPAFSGVFYPPLDGGTYTIPTPTTPLFGVVPGNRATPGIWLEMRRLPDAQQDNQGGILYGAAWRAPDQASDWFIDVVAYDNAVNPYNAVERFNWIVYDNVWGFSTAPFPGVENILVVSDYALGQKFYDVRFGDASANPGNTSNNLPAVFFGSESYFTDVDVARNPLYALTSNGILPYGSGSVIGNVPFTAGLGGNGSLFVNPRRVPGVFGGYTVGLANPLGVNSYTDELNFDGTRVDGRPFPSTNRYEVWRILARGPVPQDVYTAYLPQPEQTTPPDLRVNETAPRTTRIVERMIIWNSPFSGDLFVGAGTIIDPTTQSNLTNFVNAGGRLFVSGQDVGFALVTAPNGPAFFSTILKAQLLNDSGGRDFLSSITAPANEDNSIADEPWVRADHAYGRASDIPRLQYAYVPLSENSGSPGAFSITNNLSGGLRNDAARTAAFLGGGRIDVIAPVANAYAQFNFAANSGLITSQFPSGGRVAYASFGFETISQEFYEQNSIICHLGRRAELMHNITCGFRTGTIVGRILNASQGGSPLSDVLVRAVANLGAEGQPAIATAATDRDGNYRIVGLKPDNYVIYAYRRGFTIQHTTDITVHGAYRAQADLSLVEAPPGSLRGRVFRGDGQTPLPGIEVQVRSRNPDGTFAVFKQRDPGPTTGPDGSYNITGIPIGFYTVVANPNNVDDAGNPIPNTDPRFNPNYNPSYTTVVVTNPATQTNIRVAQGTNVVNGLVEIRAGETANIEFILTAPPQPIRGRVIDRATRAPIAGAVVIALRNNTAFPGITATTDANGNYTLPPVSEGPVTIQANARGYSPGSVAGTVIDVPLIAPDIELDKLPPGSFSGLVVDAGTGRPVPGVTVRALFQGQGTPVTVQTGPAQSEGAYTFNYRLDRVEAGDYVVTLDTSATGLTSDPIQVAVTIAPGRETQNVNFRLLPLKIYGSGLQLVGLPFDYGNADSRTAVFGLTPGTSPFNVFNVAEWTGSDYNISPTIPIRLGKGYFIRFAEVGTVQRQGTRAVATTFDIGLPTGWSLISNPFDGGDLSLSNDTDINVIVGGEVLTLSQAAARGLVRNVVFSYTGSVAGSQYVQGNALQRYFGYWFRAFQPVTLRLRAPTRAAVLEHKTITRADMEKTRRRAIGSKGIDDWRLQVAVQQGELQDTDNTIGVAPAAKNGFDFGHDTEKPPLITQAPSVYLALNGTDETGRAAPFADDIRSAEPGTKTWDFTVQSGGDGEVSVFWPNIHRLPRGLQPTLVDVATNRRVAMRSSAAYRFTPNKTETRRFRIEVKPLASRPLALINVQSKQNRAAGGFRFAFTATQDADVQADIQTLGGTRVRRLLTRARAAEETGMHWDGRREDGGALAVGPYVLNLRAKDGDGNVVQKRVPLLILR